jgi:TonB-dependent starch-binding outer membrane protein SusC
VNTTSTSQFYLNYVASSGEHDFDITAGYSYQDFVSEGSNFSRNWDEADFYDFEVDEGTSQEVPRGYVPEFNVLLSFFGRAHYSFKDKYLLTGTLRNDISSRFAKGNRAGLFPAVAVGWNIHEESFVSNVKAVSNLKLRLGWGITGQQGVPTGSDNAYTSYPYLPQYVLSTNTAQYEFGSGLVNTSRPAPYDVNFKWEETTTLNAGLDFGFLSERITGSIDIYHRVTNDLINRIPIPAGSNFSNYLITNVGNLENRGIEFALSGKIYDRQELGWSIGFNISHNKNEITKLTLTDDPTYAGDPVGGISGGVGNRVQINSVGYPARSFYVFQQVYDPEGNPIEGLYHDRTGEGGQVISNLRNKYRYYNPFPAVLAGINSSVRYKRFDLYFSGRLSLGNYVYNNRASGTNYNGAFVNTGFFNNLASYVNEHRFYSPQYWSDYFVEDASFFKMDNISLGYNATQLFGEKVRARVSFTVQNAFVITDYTGIDPEVNNGTDPGIDNNIYPRPRNFVLGVNLTF